MSSLVGRKVKTIDNVLCVFSARDLNSVSRQLGTGFGIQLGSVSEFEGREWVEVRLPEGTNGFALGASLRSHTDIPAEVQHIVRPLPISPSAGVQPPYGWGILVGVMYGIAVPIYILTAITGYSETAKAFFGQKLLPWPVDVLLGAVCAVACVGIIRGRRIGVAAHWVASIISLLLAVRLGIFSYSSLGACLGLGLNVVTVVYFVKRWRFMVS